MRKLATSSVVLIGILIMVAGGWLLRAQTTTFEPPLPDPQADIDSRIRSAIDAAHTLVRAEPRNAGAWMKFGLIYDANGFDTLAALCYEQALNLDNSNPKWWYWLGLVRADLGDFEAAMAAVEQSVTLDPTYSAAPRQLGLWFLQLGDVNAAEAAFERAMKINAGDPSTLLGMARVALEKDNSQKAAALLEAVIQRAPQYDFARLLLGTAYRRLGRLDEAETQFAKGAGSKPIYEDPWREEVLAYRTGYAGIILEADRLLARGQGAALINKLEALRRDYPDDVVVSDKLAEAYEQSGRSQEALRILEAIAQGHPEHVMTHLKLSDYYASSGRLDQAIAQVRMAVNLNPELGTSHRQLGKLLSQSGDYEGAAEALTLAIKNGRTEPDIALSLGSLQAKLARWREATKTFDSLTKRSPDSAAAFCWLARASAEIGDFQRSVAALQKAIELDPQLSMLPQTRARIRFLFEQSADRQPN